MNFIKKLFGWNKPKNPLEQIEAVKENDKTTDDPAMDPNLISVFDKYGPFQKINGAKKFCQMPKITVEQS